MQPFSAHLPCTQHRQHSARVPTQNYPLPHAHATHTASPALQHSCPHVIPSMYVLSNTRSLSSLPLLSPLPLENQPGLRSLLQVPLLPRPKMLQKHKIKMSTSTAIRITLSHQPCHKTYPQLLHSSFLNTLCLHAVVWTRNKCSFVSLVFLWFFPLGKKQKRFPRNRSTWLCLSALSTHGKVVIRS